MYMPKQYGSNGVNSDGSLMNVGNVIWDPANGGRPSIRLHPDKSAMARSTPPWLLGVEPDNKAEHDKAEHDKAEHDKAEHDKAEHDKAEHDKAEHDKAEHDKAQ
tara:strand:- start:171 stop:482 length:312 start_codon:yes stop_codon:yes gene_type:complete